MKFGSVAGIDNPISRLVQGTIPVNSKDLDTSFRLLDAVWEQGCNTFDTAHVYGGGDNERAFGKWLKSRGVREQAVIIAKGAHHNQDRRRVTPHDIESDLSDSLARMEVEYVDLYLLHRDDESVHVGPIVEALNSQQRAGRIRAFGGSNWKYTRIAEAIEYAERANLTPFAASSPQFSLAVQKEEPWPNCVSISGADQQNSREWYAVTALPLFCWSSLAGGFFSGRLTRENAGEWDDYFMKLAVTCYGTGENYERLSRCWKLARKRGQTAAQIAMAWLMHQPMNIFALVGCGTGEEFAENADALDLELSGEELKWLNLEVL